MNPRTGRPPLPDEQRRTITMKIRLSEQERETIRNAGGSDWARTELLKAARRLARRSS